MGGVGSAFEDDPLSVWVNPAGIATQPAGVSLQYQSFTVYGDDDKLDPNRRVSARLGWNEPWAVPALFGIVIPIGTEDRPQSLGLCLVSPLYLKLVFDAPDDVSPNVWSTEQTFTRVRLAYGRDFRFKAVGEEGWLHHLAVGFGADIAFTTFDATDLALGVSSGRSRSDFGGGLGLLLGLYDNTRDLKVNLGVAYQSAVQFEVSDLVTQDPREAPALNWPDQLQLGFQVFLLEGLPLRIAAEIQMVGWRDAAPKSELPGVPDFSRSINGSIGAEVRLALSPSTTLFPRMGVRFYDPPWDSSDRSKQPATGEWQLSIATRRDRFVILSLGAGIALSTAGGAVISVDGAFEYGGDSPGVSLGVVVGF